jgi:hypothetical protein
VTVPTIRGKIDVFDRATRVGVIVGPDGARFRFGRAELTADALFAVGQAVTFVPGEDGRARQIQAAEATGAFDFGRVAQRTLGSLGRHWRLNLPAVIFLAGAPAALSAWGALHLYDDVRLFA